LCGCDSGLQAHNNAAGANRIAQRCHEARCAGHVNPTNAPVPLRIARHDFLNRVATRSLCIYVPKLNLSFSAVPNGINVSVLLREELHVRVHDHTHACHHRIDICKTIIASEMDLHLVKSGYYSGLEETLVRKTFGVLSDGPGSCALLTAGTAVILQTLVQAWFLRV
jgi:hypothetical protein